MPLPPLPPLPPPEPCVAKELSNEARLKMCADASPYPLRSYRRELLLDATLVVTAAAHVSIGLSAASAARRNRYQTSPSHVGAQQHALH